MIVGFPAVSNETYAPVRTWHIVDWLPISLLYVSGWRHELRQLWYTSACKTFGCSCFSLGFSSAPEWLEPVLWPRTWDYASLCENNDNNNNNNNNDNNNNNNNNTWRIACALIF